MTFLGTIGCVLVIGGVCASAQTPPPTQSRATSTVDSAKGKIRPFMGRVLRESSGYVLKAGDLEYKLDDADVVRNYTGKNVKIMGSLDRPTNTIHVENIEPSM